MSKSTRTLQKDKDNRRRARQAKNSAAWRKRHPAKAREVKRAYRERNAAKAEAIPTPPPAMEITANAKESAGKWSDDREPWIVTHMRTLGPSTHDKKNLK